MLDTAFELKHMLEDGDDDLTFLRGLARGLVGVFESRTNNDDDTRYLALAGAGAVAARGIAVPAGALRLPGGEVLLAKSFVPTHADRIVCYDGLRIDDYVRTTLGSTRTASDT